MANQHFKLILKTLFAPLSAILLLMLGNGFFLSFTSLKLESMGFDDWVVGIVHSAYYLGMLVGATRVESVINKVGHIRAYAAYAGIGTASFMLQGLIPHPVVWFFSRLVMGFCLAVYYIVVESWFLCNATATTRGLILSIYMITLYLSQAASQFILSWIDLNGAEPFMIAALLSACSAVPITLTKHSSPKVHEPSGHSLRSLYNQSQFGFCGCLIAGVILSANYSFAPLFARVNDLSVSLLMSSCIFGGVVLQSPLGHLSDLMDRRKVLFGVTLATAIHSSAIIFLEPQGGWAYFSLFILGGLIFTLYPLSISQVCDRLQEEDITRATGMLLVAYGIGSVLGPIAASFGVGLFPEFGLFVFILGCSAVLGLIGLRSFQRSSPVPEQLQTDFVPLPRVTPVVYELDPRSGGES